MMEKIRDGLFSASKMFFSLFFLGLSFEK